MPSSVRPHFTHSTAIAIAVLSRFRAEARRRGSNGRRRDRLGLGAWAMVRSAAKRKRPRGILVTDSVPRASVEQLDGLHPFSNVSYVAIISQFSHRPMRVSQIDWSSGFT